MSAAELLNDVGHEEGCECPQCLPEVHPAPMPATALAPVQVEDWTLFVAEGAHWFRDTDLAERAEKGNPRNKDTILELIADGAIEVTGPAAAEAIAKAKDKQKSSQKNNVRPADIVKTAKIWAVHENFVVGNGATRKTLVYYLDLEAGLLLITRWRTPKAVALTAAMIRVVAAVTRGEFRPASTVEDYRGGMDLVSRSEVTALIGPIVRETMAAIVRDLPALLGSLVGQPLEAVLRRLDVIDERLQEAALRRGLASAEQVNLIRYQMKEICWLRIQVGRVSKPSAPWRSVGGEVLNDITSLIDWRNGAAKIDRIPERDVGVVFARLARLRIEVMSEMKVRGIVPRPVPAKHQQQQAAEEALRRLGILPDNVVPIPVGEAPVDKGLRRAAERQPAEMFPDC